MKKLVILISFAMLVISIAGCGKVTNESVGQNQEQQKNALGLMSTSIAGPQIASADWTLATSNAGWAPRSGMSSVVLNNKMWIVGGFDSNQGTNDVWSSSDGIQWGQAIAHAPWEPRSYHSSVAFNNKLWVIAGMGEVNGVGRQFSDVWSSPDGVNWTQVTANAIWGERHGQRSVVFDNKLWIIGGAMLDTNIVKNDVWYSGDGLTWTQVAASAPWPGRDLFGCVVYDNKIWIIGGGERAQRNDVWYSSDGANWTQATAAAPWAGRRSHTCVVYDNKMWVMGGTVDGWHPQNDVWYSTDGVNWTQSTNAPWTPRADHTSLIFNNKIWVMGGAITGWVNDVWYMGNPAISANINVDPDTINLKSKGNYLTAYIELPSGYSVNDIDSTSIKLNNTVAALSKPSGIGDNNANSIPELMVKFDRQAVQGILEAGNSMEITITGKLNDGTCFQGKDTIRVIKE